MHSPVKNIINTIFVHVTNLERSVEWYSKLLGQEYKLNEISRPVYNIQLNHYTGLTLDAGVGSVKKQSSSEYPLFNFHTDDIHASYQFIKSLGYELESEIVHFHDFSFFTISDPDQNVLMICTG